MKILAFMMKLTEQHCDDAMTLFDLVEEDDLEAVLVVMLAIFGEVQKKHRDLNAVNRVRDEAMSLLQNIGGDVDMIRRLTQAMH